MPENIQPVSISEETRHRYLNYALSVITSRALPDVRDGLKPVQRRILYTMYHDLHLHADGRPRKCATHRRRRDRQLSSARRRSPLTRPWSAWPRIWSCACRWCTARATSARSMAMPPRPNATPKRNCARWPSISWPSCGSAPSTCGPTTTAPAKSRSFCRPSFRTCSSTALPASPSAWRPTSRRTTSAR